MVPPAFITKLCMEVGVNISKNEERIKVGVTISFKALEEISRLGGHITATEIFEKITQVKVL